MALTLEEALTELGILKGKVGPLEGERDRLLGHKERLETDLGKAKTRAETAESERDDLKTKVPSDGAVTLSKVDAERWRVLKARADELGGVDKLEAKVARANELETKEAKRERKESLKQHGFNPSVFDAIAEGNPYRVEEKDDAKVVYLTVGDAEVELGEYAGKNDRADLMNYLALETAEVKSSGVPVVAQAGKRQQGRLATPEEIAERKRNDPMYSI